MTRRSTSTGRPTWTTKAARRRRPLAVSPDGKILLAGYTSGGPLGSDATIWRLTPDGGTGNVTNGALDATFGNAGTAALGGPGNYARAAAIQLQPDGKILAAGEQKLGEGPFEAVLWRLSANGGSSAVNSGLDPAFGSGGVSAVRAGAAAAASALALLGDRRILVAGSASAASSGVLVFRALGDPFSLSVVTAGAGKGTVRSSPAGIDCGAACSALIDDGSEVALAATPAAGSAFAGWSGAGCGGTAGCQVTMEADRTVTATFNPAPGPRSTAPSILSAAQSHARWREGTKLASLARARVRRVPVGTTFSFRLDQAAKARLAFTQAVAGRKVGGKCVAPTPATGAGTRAGAR